MKTKLQYISLLLALTFVFSTCAMAEKANTNSLVIYFSRGENIVNAKEYSDSLGDDVDARTSASVLVKDNGEITGTNGFIATWIAEQTKSDVYSIHVKNVYPETKKDTQKIVLNEEQLKGLYPEVEPFDKDLSQYKYIYLGFPNWYAEPPRALYTFLKENDFSGKIIIPYTSYEHKQDGFSDSIYILKSLLPNSIVLDNGLVIHRKEFGTAKEQTYAWLEKIATDIENVELHPIPTVAEQKESAKSLVGQILTKEQVEAAIGSYDKFVTGTNGCTRNITSARFFYPGFVIYSRAEDDTHFEILSID